jgi:glycosyltransferase involved in cell wall biosynthesis
MLITIITATYNSAATLQDCLQSVASQTHPSIEHLIIDGASKDETVSIAKAFPHINTIVSERDGGIYDAMNKGITLAQGEIIGILNSDDFYVDEQVIADVVNLFQSSACDIVYADLQYVDQLDTQKVVRTWKSGLMHAKSFLFGWMPPHPTLFVRRSVYERFGGFNLDLKSAADYEFMLRVLHKEQCTVAYLPRIIVKMRNGGNSNQSIKHRIFANREDKKAWLLNGLQPYFFTLVLKPARKLFQFLT